MNFNWQNKHGFKNNWNALNTSANAYALTQWAEQYTHPTLIIAPDVRTLLQIKRALRFFNTQQLPIHVLPDWEILPFDNFSPHKDIVSERLKTLSQMPSMTNGFILTTAATALHRIVPKAFVLAQRFSIKTGQTLDIEAFIQQLTESNYLRVSQVMEHGEFTVRGSVIDVFPMGHHTPIRIDLFDDEIDTLRLFDAETQLSTDKIDAIELLPAQEVVLNRQSSDTFRKNYREAFGDQVASHLPYQMVSDLKTFQGIEYYLPLFFDEPMNTVLDYLPKDSCVCFWNDSTEALESLPSDFNQRYELAKLENDRPPLPVNHVFWQDADIYTAAKAFAQIHFSRENNASNISLPFDSPKILPQKREANELAQLILDHANKNSAALVLTMESMGRRQWMSDLLCAQKVPHTLRANWSEIEADHHELQVVVAPLELGFIETEAGFEILTENQLLGQSTVVQSRRRRKSHEDFNESIKHLAELELGSPVVHEIHGVGRYQGMELIDVGEHEQEFIQLTYANDDKLFVPISDLHLISRYAGNADTAPLHKLGTDHWDKAKEKARKRAYDVAAELLQIYAQREAREGNVYQVDADDYAQFASEFPFEETEDQHNAINDVLADMATPKPMDRLVCGDVGFGKTEVAMRAAFVAVNAGQQVALLVPTTLLANQHYQSFLDRFANWPVRIAVLSRFQTGKKLTQTLEAIESGEVDIVVGTHKLIQPSVKFKSLGLVILDEEHRFGVKQKEQFKKLRAEVDVLTMTATPIPRTLNMAMSDLRDLSIISTPPARRLAVKTFVRQWNDGLIREAFLRELYRGGQIYFLHNNIDSIEVTRDKLLELIPEAKVEIAHGQMSERQLESVMSDFYHQRFNVLLCTTIIETGIDVPNANTIFIDRADKFGLAQLHQLRGRVGRSHHQAYAYMLTPSHQALTGDAEKRLAAISKFEDLGVGFALASQDLEIRGAGELLGDGQSGQIQEIGFGMYADLLEKAVKALKSGDEPSADPFDQAHSSVDLQESALIPADYLPDVHTRLVLYKRMSNAKTLQDLKQLQIEMIDRFGLLPDETQVLFAQMEIQIQTKALGIEKLTAYADHIRLKFHENPTIDPVRLIQLIQIQPSVYKMKGATQLNVHLDSFSWQDKIQHVDRTLAELTDA